MTMELANDVVLVTGASRGIGEAVLHELAARGARVIGTATSDAGAAAIAAKLAEKGFQGTGMKLNVTEQSSVDEVLQAIESQFGTVSILVNNAGITRDTLMMRMKDEDWDAIIETNLTSVFRLSKAVLRGMMKARRGRIISVASVVGVMGNAGQTNYAAAKAGIIGFSKSLAREVGSRGVTVNVVAPGFIDTDMTRELSEEHKQAMLSQIPLARLGQVGEIAHAVGFLASPHAGYITGETLHVNGGMYMA